MNYFRNLFYSFLFTVSFAETLLVPENFNRIQRAIDSATEGDTILVNEGIYCENLIVNKSITLSSYAIFENLDDWLTPDGSHVQNETILNTIIDGSTECLAEHNQSPPPSTNHWLDQADNGSVILIVKDPEIEDCITPTIFGLTIQGGYGTGISKSFIADEDEDPLTQNEEVFTEIQRLGGGILSKDANPVINFNQIINNNIINNTGRSGIPGYGGAANIDEDFGFINYHGVEIDIIQAPSRCDYETFDFTNNFFFNNNANSGKTISNKYIEGITMDLSGSSFDIAGCESSEVSNLWVETNSEAETSFNSISAQDCAIQDPIVYVDSNIDSECLTIECGTENNPFKTIKQALIMTVSNIQFPIKLMLENGTYSPETGEQFPIVLPKYLSLEGEQQTNTIIDAMGTSKALIIDNTDGNSVRKLTIKGGYAYFENPLPPIHIKKGAGLYIRNSNPFIQYVTVRDNYASFGGGIQLKNSNAILRNMTIEHNDAIYGAGMHLVNSNPFLNNLKVRNNSAQDFPDSIEIFLDGLEGGIGGGIYMMASSPLLSELTIKNNTSITKAGGIYINSCAQPIITNTLIYNNSSNLGGGIYFFNSAPIVNFTTIAQNTSDFTYENQNCGGGIFLSDYPGIDPIPRINNSIVWGNSSSICMGADEDTENGVDATLNITYSTIEGTWEENSNGNMDLDPTFINPNNDFNLQPQSSCVDTGDPNSWYQDTDGSPADMGYTGGSLIYPNFTEYDFGEVGEFPITQNFILHNFRNTPITINAVDFFTEHFTSSTTFPITIYPYEKGIIGIRCLPQSLGPIEDNMIINSPDLLQSASIQLNAIGTAGNLISGNLQSGTLPVNTYIVSGDIHISNDDEVVLLGGTKFLFDGAYDFVIEGTLKAQGTEQDSIIFDIYDDGSNSICEDCIYEFTEYGSECCDSAWEEYGITCSELESNYSWNCSGCSCPGDDTIFCGDGICNGDENYFSCPDDCSELDECQVGYVIDCSGDGDCCDEGWIGDGYPDCIDQAYGCDLTCYDNDGGDCDDYQGENCDFDDCQEQPDPFYGLTCCEYIINNENLGCTELLLLQIDCHCSCPDYIGENNDIYPFEKIKNAFPIPSLHLLAPENRLLKHDSLTYIENNSSREETWRGFTLNHVTDETIFEYVRISGAEKDWGGAMKCSHSNPILSHMTISNNKAIYGAGLYLTEFSNATLHDIVINNNEATSQGGGLFISSSNPTLNKIDIINNTTTYGYGGGIEITMSNAILTNSIIYNNQAFWGGGINMENQANIIMEDVQILNNHAWGFQINAPDGTLLEGGGGGVSMYQNSNPVMRRVIIANNSTAGQGGGLYLFDTNPALLNVTISGNTASYGGGTYLDWEDPYEGNLHSDPIIINSIMWDNNPESILIEEGAPDISLIAYSNIEGETENDNNGNIHLEPNFINPQNNNFNLDPDSPCIDAGTSFFPLPNGLTIQLNPQQYYGPSPDMGSIEFYPDIITDLNHDQYQDILDIIILINIIINNENYNILGDLNSDGLNDIRDIIELLHIVLGN